MRFMLVFVVMLIQTVAIAQSKSKVVVSNAFSQLDLLCKDGAIVIPKVILKVKSDVSTTANVNSFLVYNTAKGVNISPGYYYWYNSKWNSLKNVITGNGVPVSIGSVGDVYVDSSTRDVYIQNGTMWIAKVLKREDLPIACFEEKTGVLSYNTNEIENKFNLKELVPNFELPVVISLNASAETVSYVDKNGALTVLNLKVLLRKSKDITSTY